MKTLPSLASCVRSGSMAQIQENLNAGMSPSSPLPENGYTPLQWAARHGNVEAVKALVAHGAYLNQTLDGAPRNAEMPPLYHALAHGQGMMAKTLVAMGANVKVVDRNGEGPLHWAVKFSHGPCCEMAVKTLLGAGADPNCANSDGMTPLMEAARRGNTRVAQMLLEAGATLAAKNRYGKTASDCLSASAPAEQRILLAVPSSVPHLS